jgi:CubicO group peptidase (beta-lactamase class C family)
MIQQINKILQNGVDQKKFSGAVWLVYKHKTGSIKGTIGYSSLLPNKEEMKEDTIFDLASLTKPLVTAPMVLKTLSEGFLDIEKPLQQMNLTPFASRLSEINIFQLMTHTSGVKSWYPCYAAEKQALLGTAIVGTGGRILYEKAPKVIDKYIMTITTLPFDANPGEKVIYSCLGYIILANLLQVRKKIKFKEEAKQLIFNPLKLERTFFDVPENLVQETAAGEEGNMSEKMKVQKLGLKFSGWRKGIIRGQVNDCNSFYANSETGNSGLFSTVDETLKIAKLFLPDSNFFTKDELRLFYDDLTEHLDDHRSIAWRRAISKSDPAYEILSDEAIGHTGYTGTALWIDPVKNEIYILFINRLHPKISDFPIELLRREFLKHAVLL